ncbi:DUF2577 domain-containing protein [Paenibacillus sp. HWE-109]|uniref:DUF2577 domain-containing protein n=1 Tax=Paenibacillus sp. HWE-109 TaxID=1306526 RepID=UPI001EDE1863|nr:DUF2577 domain-containing protein [Paenibacillus sp. HWE-109]UKS30148.1 DUF2577 domain-containing protein [Paenibacillus sp. HWE-109]
MENDTLQGTGISRLVQAIREIGRNDYDRIELATVTVALPAIAIKIDNMALTLDAGDIVIAEHLTEHTRQVTINGGSVAEMTVKSPLEAGDRVIVVSMNGGQSYVVLDKAVVL